MKKFICIAIILAAGLVAVPVSADRVIFAPTGIVLGGGEIRGEAATSPSNDDSKIYWLGMGLQRLEINVMRFDFKTEAPEAEETHQVGTIGRSFFDIDGINSDDLNVVGAELSVIPETTLTPGIGIGVWDVTGETPDGRGYYLAISKMLPLTGSLPSPIRDVKVHAGFGIDGIDGFFAGAEATIPLGIRLSAEYFKEDVNFSVGWGIIPGLQVKAYILDGETYYGLMFSPPL